MIKRFLTLERAKSYRMPNVHLPFIVREEIDPIPYLDDEGNEKYREHEYLAFKTVEEYYSQVDQYSHCHELITSRGPSPLKPQGRLVFDFDIKSKFLPPEFKAEIERTIIKIFQKDYIDVDTRRLRFVWLNSENTKKISKHLIVKNAYFVDDWIEQMRSFYMIFEQHVKENPIFSFVSYRDIVDVAMIQRDKCFRMPFNSKRGGSPMLFEEEGYSFYDGLVCLYRHEDKKSEQMITFTNMNQSAIRYVKNITYDTYNVDEEEALDHFRYFCEREKCDSFSFGGVQGPFIHLKRSKPSKCKISGCLHENENAYLRVTPSGDLLFSCYRGCTWFNGKKSTKLISKKRPVPEMLAKAQIPDI